MCVVIHAAKIIHKKGKMQIIGGKITILFVFFMRLLQNAKSNEISSSKIEEVPEGRRSMTTQKMLLIRRIRQGWCVHTPPCPLYLRGGVASFIEL